MTAVSSRITAYSSLTPVAGAGRRKGLGPCSRQSVQNRVNECFDLMATAEVIVRRCKDSSLVCANLLSRTVVGYDFYHFSNR
jgi:hypothetical protein